MFPSPPPNVILQKPSSLNSLINFFFTFFHSPFLTPFSAITGDVSRKTSVSAK